MPNGAACRSRATRSHAAWREGAAEQWTWRPQGPDPAVQCVQTKPSAVPGTFAAWPAQSASRTPEQFVSQYCPVSDSFWLKPVPSAVIPQPLFTGREQTQQKHEG